MKGDIRRAAVSDQREQSEEFELSPAYYSRGAKEIAQKTEDDNAIIP